MPEQQKNCTDFPQMFVQNSAVPKLTMGQNIY